MKDLKFVLIWIFINLFPIVSFAQDVDGDGINDDLEKALATKFAPEWRFSKKTNWNIINSSNQNIDEENYPCSVDYLIRGNSKIPKVQFYYDTPFLSEHPFTDINSISSMVSPVNNRTSSDPFFGDNCNEGDDNNIRNSITLEFDDNLYGEPTTFPTYYHCGKISNTSVSITYFLFSAFDNKHETGSSIFANHRGDWEQFIIVIKGIDIANGNIDGTIDYFKFSQHGDEFITLKGNSDKLRFVKATHPKMFVALTSHAIYPEPGILFNRIVPVWPDLYDDIFLGNGMIVQTWLPERQLINLGEKNTPMSNPSTKWVQYKGRWGGLDSPFGPSCKWSEDITNVQTWDQFIVSGYDKYWNDIKLDCYPKFSMNYTPSPNYDCSLVIDCRKTCEDFYGSDRRVYNTLKQAVNDLPNTQNWQICMMPCYYPQKLIINKKMTLKAIEGTVIVGR
jgi:hypothetical protein